MRMKAILPLVFLLSALSSICVGQNIVNYNFQASTGTYVPITAGISPTLTGGGYDDGYYNGIPIGFTFYYMGKTYTWLSASTNGYVSLGTNITDLYALFYNSFNRGCYLPTDGPRPALAPLMDDLALGWGQFSYQTTGSPGSRVFAAEWKNAYWDYSNGSPVESIQLQIHEDSSLVRFTYLPDAGAPLHPKAGCGITAIDTGAGTYLNIDTFALSATVSSTVFDTLLNNKPDTGLTYTFLPIYRVKPAAPLTLAFHNVTQTSMTVAWTDNSTNETFFEVYDSLDGSSGYELAGTVQAPATAGTGGLDSVTLSGLDLGAIYYFRVYAKNEGGLPSDPLTGGQATSAPATITSQASGDWSQNGTWTGGVPPTAADNAVIQNGHTVIINTAANCVNLTVNNGGILQYEPSTPRTLTVSQNVTVSNGGILRSDNAGTIATHALSVSRNLTNNGTIDFSTNSNTAGAAITFIGAANNYFSGTGATTDIWAITVNKGADTSRVLEMNLSNFTVRGAAGNDANGFLTLTNGVFKLSGSFTYASRVFAAGGYTIGATTGLWLSNPNFTVTALAGSATVNGILRIGSGSYNVGVAANDNLVFGGASSFFIEGGSLAVAGQMSISRIYRQNGGTVTLCTQGNTMDNQGSFAMAGTNSKFYTAGGSLVLQNISTAAAPVDYDNQTVYGSMPGGKVVLGNAASGAAKTFLVRGYLPSLEISNTSANHVAKLRGNTYLYGSLAVNPGTTFDLAGQYLRHYAFVRDSVKNNGTIVSDSANCRWEFLADSVHVISGPGSYGDSLNIIMSKTTTGDVVLARDLMAKYLTLTYGKITTGGFVLTLDSNGAVGRTNGWVNGNFKKYYRSGGAAFSRAQKFEVGSAGQYTPDSVVFHAVTTAGHLTCLAVRDPTGYVNAATPASAAKRHWTLTAGPTIAFDSCRATFWYNTVDFNTGFSEATDEAAMVVGKYNGSWSLPAIGARSPGGPADGGSIEVTSLTSFSDYTFARNPAALDGSLGVQLSAFTVSVGDGHFNLTWRTESEKNTYSWIIQRSDKSDTGFTKVGQLSAQGTTNNPYKYVWSESCFAPEIEHFYRLVEIDLDGTTTVFGPVSSKTSTSLPMFSGLNSIGPNPFSMAATIRYQVAAKAMVKVAVYNIVGQLVKMVADKTDDPGYYAVTWDGNDGSGRRVAAGAYICRLEIAGRQFLRKVMVLR